MIVVKGIFKNILSLTSAEIITRILSFIVIAYLARILNTNGFGMISFAQAILTYFMLFSHVGLTTFGTREIARNQFDLKNLIPHILGIRIVLSTVSFTVLLIALQFFEGESTTKILILIYCASVILAAFALDWVFMGLEKMNYVGVFRVVNALVYFGLIFLLVKGFNHILFVPIAYFISYLSAVGVLFYFFVNKFNLCFSISFDTIVWRHFLRQSIPMGMALILTQIYYNFDTIFLKFYYGNIMVGLYSAAYKIILMLNQISIIYSNAIFPLLSRYFVESIDKLNYLVKSSVRILALLSLPIGLGGTILARNLIITIYGQNYLNSILPFQILIWSFVINAICATFAHALLACNRQKQYLVGVAIGMCVNIGLNSILIPFFNNAGAAIATFVSNFSVFVFMFLKYGEIQKVKLLPYIVKPLIAGLSMSLVIIKFFHLNIFLLFILGAFIYFFVLFLIKGITYDEISILRHRILTREFYEDSTK